MTSIACAFDARTIERFEAKVDRSGGPSACHLWTASVDHNGYGQMWSKGALHGAHRVAYEIAHRPIPDGLHVCHRCDVRLCVNPAHLFIGTVADNSSDKTSKGRQAVGEAFPHAKLTGKSVCAIRQDLASGMSLRRTARRHGVGQTTVFKIKAGQRWKHVEAER